MKSIRLPVLVLTGGISSCYFSHAQRFDCDPCIDRVSYTIKAITHGVSSEDFWQEMKATMEQAGNDMRVNFVMDLYETWDSETMAADIRAAAADPESIDALIVTMPSPEVQDAVEDVLDTIPVFGFNAALDPTILDSINGFVGSDDALAGRKVGKRITQLVEEQNGGTVKSNGLFINHAPGVEVLDTRFTNIKKESEDVVDWTVISSDDVSNAEANLTAALANCTYDVIQLGGLAALEVLLSALDTNDCSPDDYILGVFDVNTEVYHLIGDDVIEFTVSQQTYVQGAMPVVMATLFATTGKGLTIPSDGMYLSGPRIISKKNMPSNEIEICEGEGFPVCSSFDARKMSEVGDLTCACVNRPGIKIASITHAQDGDTFWDPVFKAFEAAATDMNINLSATRFDVNLTSEEVIAAQTALVEDACDSDIDGLIVTFPAESVLVAANKCVENKIPVIDVNAGPDLALANEYQYVGQVDYYAGLLAGKRILKTGVQSGWCVSHANVSVLRDRCGGFEQAFDDAGVEYMGVINVNATNPTKYKELVEAALGPGNWTGIGVLAAGGPQIGPIVGVVDDHPELTTGVFDTNPELYPALEKGKVLFGIDQNSYLQGYLPVAMITWTAYTNQKIINERVATGPRFVTKAPSEELQTCVANNFATCTADDEESGSDESSTTSGASIFYATSAFLAMMLQALVSW